MILNMESTSSHLKNKSNNNSASSEMRGNIIPNSVTAIISQSEVSMKTLTEQTHNTGTISRENFSHADEQNTPSSAMPTTQSQTTIIPETYSTTITGEGSHMEANAGMTATTTDSNTGTNIILTASMSTSSLVNSTTTTITIAKPNKHNTSSISLVKNQQGPKQKFIQTGEDEDIREKPQRQPGK